VNENCTACGECEKAVETGFDSDYDYGKKKRKGGSSKDAGLDGLIIKAKQLEEIASKQSRTGTR
jgi:ferredoxin